MQAIEMSREIQIFNNVQFGQIRVATTESGEPLFCLVDLCNVLNLTTPSRVKERLDDDMSQTHPIQDSLGREQPTTFVTEAGMYTVILRSDSPKAKPIQRWVTSEVLPSIRKHGMYATATTIDNMISDPDFAIQLLTNLKEERQKRIAVEQENKELQPKALYADAVSGSKSSCLIGELAKILRQNGINMGQNRLFEWLRDNGYLGKCGERRNIPNQQYIDQGLFELKQGVRSGNDGVMHTTITPKVTGKGQVYFVTKFLDKAS